MTEEVLERHKKKVGPHSARDINMYDNKTNPAYPRHPGEILDMDGMRRMIDGYDNGVRYMDEHIGRFFDEFSRQGVVDDLVVIITACFRRRCYIT
jgi:choline-sulfatase